MEAYRGGSGVSVVIPTHNRADRLLRAVDSVLRQTQGDIEVVVVDDASTDATREAIGTITDTRVRYLRREVNGGGAAARNTGIDAATGDFVAFLDDDDEWRENKLERQLAAIGDADAILCGAVLKDSGVSDVPYRRTTIGASDVKRGFVFGAGTSTLLVRTEIIRDLRFDEELPCYQDWDLLLRLAQRHSIRYLPEELVVFDNGGHERITTKSRQLLLSDPEPQLKALYKHRQFLGPYWFRFHLARRLLTYLRRYPSPWRQLAYTTYRCGPLAVARVYYERLRIRMARRRDRFMLTQTGKGYD